jgi:hypothetical protein
VATAHRTTDHNEIREWVESKGGHPAFVEGTGGVLRIDFGQPEERLESVDWDRFFDVFDRSNVAFLYDPEGHMVKFVAARGGRKKSTGGRKKSTGGRKKSSSSSSGGRKKSTGGRKKSTGGRKKSSSSSSGGRKKSTSGRKKSSSSSSGGRKKSTGGRKKSSGRKYGPKASRKVERAMHEMKRGELKSGRSGKKVKSRKQAIAIGLSEARRSGAKAPANPNRKRSSRKR